MPLPLILGMAALGLLKGMGPDKAKEERSRYLESERERYSGWTGQHGREIASADPLGNAMQFGMTGAMLGQGMEDMDMRKAAAGKNAELIDSEIARNSASMDNQMASQRAQKSIDDFQGTDGDDFWNRETLYGGKPKKSPFTLL